MGVSGKGYKRRPQRSMSRPRKRPTPEAPEAAVRDPVPALIADALRRRFGTRISSALLFGSRAVGAAQPDSDYDVAVFLTEFDADRDRLRLWGLADDLFTGGLRPDDLLAYGRLAHERAESPRPQVHFLGFPADGLTERTTLMLNIRRTAISLPGMERPEIPLLRVAEESGPLKPETADLLAVAEAKLGDALKIQAAGVLGSAAREAYTAALHAARALIFEERAVAPKTHAGTRALFHETAIRPGRLPKSLARVLSEGLEIKVAVDYAGRPVLSDARHTAYIEQASAFIAAVKVILQEKPP
jgi:uncharacterized protein (UPF0332 family)/predicted nucleotidyltransferase